ncbi:hypothetical protein RZS08_42785 [Arthrospira platensis SPKY1]|nr:hypothetical protein [Arthrospira platensis SPKY1]
MSNLLTSAKEKDGKQATSIKQTKIRLARTLVPEIATSDRLAISAISFKEKFEH